MMKTIRRMPSVPASAVKRLVKGVMLALLSVFLSAPFTALAQSAAATTTTLTVTPGSGATGSIFTLAAAVQSGGAAVTGGTVTFSDSYNGVTKSLGAVQVQSAHGTPGTAVLKIELGGVGTHSITATFGADSNYSASTSTAQTVILTGTYVTSTALVSSGSPGNYTLTATVAGFGQGAPTGNVTFNDTTTGDTLGTAALNATTLASGFAPQQTYPSGYGPYAIAVGDFNGDGKLDLAVTNGNTDTVSVFLGNGDGTVQAQVTYTVGDSPDAITVGDFNGDGKLDLAITNSYDNTISVLLGNGDGTFQTQVTYATEGGSNTVAAGDFNGDGKLDLAITNSYDNTISVLLGNGDGTFQTRVTYAVGNYPLGIVVGDFNGDGKLDLAVANDSDGTLSVLLGNGDGTFQAQVIYALGDFPTALAAGDFNGDGKLDLAVVNDGDNDISVLLGNGDGTFQAQVTYAVGNDPNGITVGDFNGDGRPDLAVANGNTNTVSVLLGNGDGTFQTQVTYMVGSGPYAIAVGDFNGDGKPDLAVGNYGAATVSVLLNAVTETATLAGVVVPGTGAQAIDAVYTGDINLGSSTSPSLSLTAGIATALGLTATPTSSTPGQPVVLTATVSPSSSGSLTTNGETITFLDGITTLGTATLSGGVATLTTTALPLGVDSLTAVYAGDGSFLASASPADLVVVAPATTTTLSVSPGSGTTGNIFTLTAVAESGGTALTGGTVTFKDSYAGQTTILGAVQVQAANGTAVLQTVLAGAGSHSITATYARDSVDLASTSSAQTVTIAGTYATSAALAYSGSAGNYTLTTTLTGFGRGTPTGNVAFNDTTAGVTLGTAALNASTLVSGFTAQQTYGTGLSSYVAVGDFNGDGIPDLAVTAGNNVAVLLGNGDGTFQAQVTYAVGSGPDAIVVGDFNGDGKLDLAVANGDFGGGNTISILLGNGDGTFQSQVTYAAGPDAIYIAVGDFNGDGKLDLVTPASVLLGNGDGTFQNPVTLTSGASIVSLGLIGPYAITVGDFNGDGAPDLALTLQDGNGNNWVGISLGNGNGTFQNVVAYPLEGNFVPESIVAGDFNGDGKLDLATANGDSNVSILLGNGDGTFQAQVTYSAGEDTAFVAVSDFNGDGKPDLVVANHIANTVSVLLGNGDGTFQSQVIYATGKQPQGVSVSDFNGDGRPDLVVANNSGGAVSVLLGEVTESATLTGISVPGTGTHAVNAVYAGDTYFSGATSPSAHLTGSQIATSLSLSANPASSAPGQPVVLTAMLSPASDGSLTTDGETVTFLNGTTTLGTGTLTGGVATLTTSALPTGADSVTASYPGDANFAASQSAPLSITVGTPPPSGPTTTLSVTPASGANGTVFTLTAVSQSSGGTAVTGGAVTFYDNYNGVTSTLGTVEVQTANGTAVLKTPLGGAGTHTLTASYGGDSIDQASTSAAQTVTLTGLFPSTTSIAFSGAVGNYTLTATVAGIGNGTPTGSVVFNDTSTTATLGTAALNPATLGSGFSAPQSVAAGSTDWPHGAVTGDFNGDGIPDLAVVNINYYSNDTVSILLGNGDGTFQAPVTYPLGEYSTAIAVGDFNGDGKLDLVVTNDNDDTVSVLLGNGDGTFQPQVTYAVGGDPDAIAIGDFNGDGKPDLAVANYAEDTVSILLGNGDGTFQAKPYVVVGSSPMSVAVGDFNGDGKLDLAVGNIGDRTVSILLGNGDGTFQTQTIISGVGEAIDIAVADFNGDGKSDLALANSDDGWVNEDINLGQSNTISVLLGKGDGTFQTPVAYTTGYGPSAIVAADINKDGKLDLVVTNSELGQSNSYNGNTVSLLLGNGDGTFQSQTTYPTGTDPIAVAVGDFNGDGRPDLAVEAGTGTINVSLGEATETATLTNLYVPGSGTAKIDATYAGNTYFATSTSSSVALAAGQIVTTLTLTANPASTVPGQPVVMTATLSPASVGSETTDGATITFLNGTATLGTATLSGGVATLTTSSLPLGANPITAVFAGDPPFNASTSLVDNVVIAPATTTTLAVTPGTGATGSVFILTAAVQLGGAAVPGGTITFQDSYNGLTKALGTAQIQTVSETAVLKTTLAGAGSHTITANFSGTGTGGSSVSAPQTVTVTGTYSTATTLVPSGVAGNYTLAATVTGFGNGTPSGNVAFNTTTGGTTLGTAALNPATLTGAFVSPQTYPISGPVPYVYAIAVGDFNGDGIPDMAVSNLNATNVSIFLGKGDGTFQAQATTYPTGHTPVAIAVGDFNGDGKLDLVTTNYGSTSGGGTTISVLLGNGDGTFQTQVAYTVGNSPFAVAVGDFNRDGKLDLAVANVAGDTISILLGNGDGTFQPQQTFGVDSPESVAVGDFNGDGKLDLAVASSQLNSVSILLGNGDGTFQTAVEYPAGTAPYSVFVGDFNGDGKPDLAVGNNTGYNGYSGGISVLLGNGDGTFQPQVAYKLNQAALSDQNITFNAVADINGDGKPDLICLADSENESNGAFGSAPGAVVVLLGNGDGTFQPQVNYPAAAVSSPIGVAIGDFNGDGRPDAAVADFGSDSAYVLLNEETETATLTGVSVPASGTQAVDAAYAGDTNFSASTSAPVNLAAGIATAVTVTADPVTSTPGQPVVLTATLVPSSDGSLTTNGETITFLNGTTVLGAGTLTGGVATLTTSSLSSGQNSVTAVYAGDATFNASTSPAFVTYVASATATTLNVTPGSGATGSIFALTATVQSGGTSVSGGTVTFTDSYNGLTKALGSTQLQSSGGTAVLKTTLAGAGSHSITASYGGIASEGASASTAQTITVTGTYATATTLSSSGTAGNYALTATVAGYGNGTPTGSVVFNDTTGGVTLGTTPLNSATLVSGFSAPQTSPTGTGPGTAVTGDFNNDGIPDLAIGITAGNSGSVEVLLGKGDGTFQAQTSTPVGFAPGSKVAGDFNGDGKLDLAVSYEGGISILLGNGDGTFQAPVTYAVNGNIILTGDFNEDGKPDLAVLNGTEIGVLLGNGDGTFQAETTFVLEPSPESYSYPVDLIAGDFNGDGKLDLAVSQIYDAAENSYNAVGILLGNGDGTFQAPVTHPIGKNPGLIAAGDFNGDGKLDLAASDEDGIDILLGNGDGTFQAARNVPGPGDCGGGGCDFAVGDFNGDGRLDLVSNAVEGILLLLGNGDGTFSQELTSYSTGTSGFAGLLTVADFNGDGKPDVVALDDNNNLADVILGEQIETATLTGLSVPGSGTPSVNAAYSGDTNFSPSSSSPITLTASQIATTLTLTANAPPGSQQVTLVAVLNPASDGSLTTNGETVTFLTGTITIGTATLSNGVATLVTTSIPAGATNLTASYPGDANFQASQSAPTSVVLKAILLVTANSLTRPLNQANPTLTYTISGFVNGDTQSSATTGAPSLSTTATQTSPAGSYPITITQGTLAAPNYDLTFINGTLTVTGESQTLTFPAIANTIYGPTPITLNATASSGLPVTYTVTGPAAVSGSTLTLTGAGTVTVTANQVGNGTYAAATAVSQSFTVSPAVLTATATSVSRAYGVANPTFAYVLSGFVNGDTQASATTGAPSLTTTATQSSAQGTYPITIAQGTLAAKSYTFTFINGTLTITGVPLTVSANNASRAYGAANPTFSGSVLGAQNGDTFTETFSTPATATSSPGTYPITPAAAGTDLSDYTVTTVNGILTVAQASTTVTLAANNSTSGAGSAVTFTAQVAPSTSGTPTGTVNFYNGASLLGTGFLNASGQATYSSNALAIGSYSVTAAYSGDVNFTASTSPALTETIVEPGSFTLGSSPSNQTVSAGGAATYTITVTPTGALGGPVTFSASGLPTGAIATFSPASLSPDATPATSTLTIQTGGSQAAAITARSKSGSHPPLLPFAVGLLMLPLFRVRSIRHRLSNLSCSFAFLVGLVLSLGALIALSGCGGSSSTATSTQSPVYTVTVTGTSGALQQSTTVTLTVQ